MIKSSFSYLSLILLPLLLGCAEQGDTPRDSGGTVMRLSQWTPIDLKGVAVSVAALKSVTVTKAEEQVRDNSIVHQRILFDGQKGYMFLERALDGFYHMGVKEEILDKIFFEKWLESSYKEKMSGLEKIRRISENSQDRGGYIATFASRNSDAECLVARAGYKLNAPLYDNDFGQFDTIIIFRYCGTTVTYERLAKFLGNLTLPR